MLPRWFYYVTIIDITGSLLNFHQVFSFFWWLFLALNLASGGSFELSFYFLWMWTYYSLNTLFSVTGWSRLSLISPHPCPTPVRREPWLLLMKDKWKASLWGLNMFSAVGICSYLCAYHCSCFNILSLTPNFPAFLPSIFVNTISDGEKHWPSGLQHIYQFSQLTDLFSKYNQSPTSSCFSSLMPLYLLHVPDTHPSSSSQHPPSTQPCFHSWKKAKERNSIWWLSPSGSVYVSKFAHHWTRQYLQVSLKSKLSNSLHDIVLKHLLLLFRGSCG